MQIEGVPAMIALPPAGSGAPTSGDSKWSRRENEEDQGAPVQRKGAADALWHSQLPVSPIGVGLGVVPILATQVEGSSMAADALQNHRLTAKVTSLTAKVSELTTALDAARPLAEASGVLTQKVMSLTAENAALLAANRTQEETVRQLTQRLIQFSNAFANLTPAQSARTR